MRLRSPLPGLSMSSDTVHPVSTRARNFAARRSITSLIIVGAILAACSGDTLTGPSSGDEVITDDKTRALLALTCNASVASRTIQCSPENPLLSASIVGLPGFGSRNDWMPVGPVAAPAAEILIGNQNVNIKVITKDIAVAVDSFVFNAGITNLSPAPIGTIDGENSDNSLKIFFSSGPTVTDIGGGTASVANETGSATFTGPNQPYYDYGEILFQDDTSAFRQWRIAFTPEVRTFVFTLLVSASVEHPDGFVTIHPPLDSIDDGATTQLVDSVRNPLGWPILGQSVTWSSSNEAVATVSSTGLVTGASPGTATIFAKSVGKDSAEATIVVESTASPATAADDTTTSTSAPGDSFHGAFNTQFTLGAPGLLSNDNLGTPAATVTSFGGGALGTSVTDNAAGASAPFGTGGSVTVSANGAVSMTPPTGFTGYVTFFYRITNASGTSDAFVRLAVGARPSSANSTYGATLLGNVGINTAASTMTKVSATGDALLYFYQGGENGGGSVHTDGTYEFTPDAGFTGTGRMFFNVSNGFGTSTNDTITFNVSAPRIWFVHPAAGGNGRYGQPLGCIVGAGTCISNVSLAAGDIVHINSGTFANTGALTLPNNVRIIGAGASGNFADAANANVTWPADAGEQPTTGAARPTINSAGANVFVLGSGNTMRGLISGNATGASITGSAVGAFSMGSSAIVNTTGRAIDLTTSGTLAVSVDSLVSNGGTGNGVNLQNQAGAFTSGLTRVTNPSGTGINVTNSAGFSFGSTFVKKTNSGVGVNLATNTGTTSFSLLVDSTASGAGIVTSNAGTVSISDGNIRAVGGSAINVSSTTFNATLDSTSTSGGPTQGVLFSAGSVVNASLGVGSLSAASEALSVTSASGTISYAGAISGSSRPVSVSNASPAACPNVTVSGKVLGTSNGILVQNCSSGTITFSGPDTLSTGANKAVQLAGNTGATVNFTGGALSITTTSGSGFEAAGGGTVSVTGAANSIVSGTGTALSVTNTTIGGSGLTFRSVSSGASTAAGIILNGTGTSGGLTVTGTGSPGSGGTIAGKTGGNAWSISGGVPTLNGATTGVGVYLNSNRGTSLSWMQLNDFSNAAISAFASSNLSLSNVVVSGASGDDVAVDEGAVFLYNLTGTGAITGSTIGGGFENNLLLLNTSGTLDRMVVSGSTFNFNNTTSGNNNILVESRNAGTTLKFTLASSTIKGARADWINLSNNSSSTMDAIVGGPNGGDGNLFDNLGANAHPGAAAGGNRVVTGAVGPLTLDIRNNTLRGSKGEAIRVRGSATGTTTGTVNGRVRNNTIGVQGTANSGSAEGSGIFVFGDGGSDMNVAITNNAVYQYNNHGIRMDFGDEINEGSVFNMTVTGNTISTPGNINTDFNAIHLNNGTVGATDNFTSCIDIGGAGVFNSVSGGGSGAIPPNNADVRLRQRQSTTVRLPGYAGADNNDAAVVSYLGGRNTLATAAASNTVPTGGGFTGGAACTQPTVP